MADYPIVMRQLNNSGEYDTLYPASTSDQIEGLLEETTKTAFGLSTSAVPDDIFQKLANAVILNSTYGNLAVGSTVQLNVNGTPTNFLVVHQGNPDPSVYDESCSGTWLLMQDCYESRQWNNSNNNDYENSTIDNYLNTTFLNLFEANIRDAIKQVKLPYRKGAGYEKTVTSGASGLSTKIFLLSATEVGFNMSYMPTNEGACLSYFSGTAQNGADNKRVAKLNGSATGWWLRSPYCNPDLGSAHALLVRSNGGWVNGSCFSSYGIRPCIIMPSGLELPNGTDVTTTISNILGIPGLQGQIDAGAKIAVVSYAGTGTYGENNPNTITFPFIPKIWSVFCRERLIGDSYNYYFFSDAGNIWIWGKDSTQFGAYSINVNWVITFNGGTATWYTTSTGSTAATQQHNNSSYTYYAFAIG